MTSARIATIANDSRFCESRQNMKKLEDDLTSPEAMNAPLDEIERMLRTQGREMLRVMMQTHFDQRAEQERPVDVRGVDGVERTETRRGSRKVETEFGEVELERNLYRAPGVERLAPLDATMQLPTEKYSYELRRMVAEESSKSSFDEVVELMAKRTGANVPKRQVEELVVRAAQDFDLFYRDRLREAEETDHLMVLSFDGKGIAMRLSSVANGHATEHEWHHLVGTFDGIALTIYVDGVLGERNPSPNALDLLAVHLLLGAGGSPTATVLLGSLGQVAIYDYALDPARISAHYHARSP